MTRKNEIKEVLGSIIKGKILCDEPMSLHTSLAVGGNADALVYIENEDQLALVVGRLKEKEINIFIAGNLTNVIVRDGGYRGAILLMTGSKGVRLRLYAAKRLFNFRPGRRGAGKSCQPFS